MYFLMSESDISRDEIRRTRENYNQVAEFFNERTKGMQIDDIETFIDILDRKDDPEILDIGCGPGRDAKTFVEDGMDVLGIDISEEMLDIAREKVPQAEFKKIDMRNLPFDSDSFDGIWSAGSLQHIPRDEMRDLLEELRRILKEGGILFSDLREGEGEKVEETEDYGETIERFMVYWQKEEFIQLLEDAGFEILDSKAVEERWTDTGEKRDFRKIRIFSQK